MRCPFCSNDDDKVIDSRSSDNGFAIRRRRVCLKCERRYTTFERLLETGLKVTKKNGSRQPFDPAKIRDGLQKACWKRPVSDEDIEQAVSDIEQHLYKNFDTEIDSDALGEIVMKILIELDQVAYVRFASVYRQFKDVNDFVDELRPMMKKRNHRNGRTD